VTGLPQKTAYCFALTTTDAAGVTSEISNVVQATVPDGEAPAAPVLSGTQVSADSVELDWVAVGDDGTTGAATTYELRYGFRQPYDDCVHLCPLTAEMFSRAFVIEGLPAPQQAGQHESFIARGLQQGTLVVDYCFALKVTDEAGNSTLSPSAQVTNAYR
jgi:hypothetical protein